MNRGRRGSIQVDRSKRSRLLLPPVSLFASTGGGRLSRVRAFSGRYFQRGGKGGYYNAPVCGGSCFLFH